MAVRLGRIKSILIEVVLALVLLAVPGQALQAANTWYVDKNCAVCGQGTMAAPFQTITAAVTSAHSGDTIRVAQGTYTENLFINTQLTLMGGYWAQAPAWPRDVGRYETVIISGDRTVPGDWNGDSIGSLSIIRDEYAYRMWYSAGSIVGGQQIGYADSPDGIHWFQPYHTPLLSLGPLGAWDETMVGDPSVALVRSPGGRVQVRMWYVGADAFGARAIGYATSPDALTWQKYGSNPVLRPDSVDGEDFGHPTVIQEDPQTYKMWYSGGSRIWLATSSDGIYWTKHLDTPALMPGASGAWDSARVYAPVVVANGERYEMWYVGEGDGASAPRIGYAWSVDGLTWTKSGANPVLAGQPGQWEEGTVTHPAVIVEGAAGYKMWYRGASAGRQAIGQATSANGVDWTRYEDNPVLKQGTSTYTGRPVVSFGSQSGTAILDGFTISDGYAEYGGGILAYEASPIIRACRVVGNVAYHSGGGLWLGNGTPLIENTWIGGNSSVHRGGGLMVNSASLTVRDSSIVDNTSTNYGGGLAFWGESQPSLARITVTGNTARWGGGISIGDEVDLDLAGSLIADNNAQQAAGIRVAYATMTVTNTFVVANTATAGGPGGIEFWYASGGLVNTTIADNAATVGSGGIAFGTSDPARQLNILNSILFFNGDDLSCASANCTVRYSDVAEGIADTGNISANPLFADRTVGDYHLRLGSPAINAGTSEGAPALDFEGDPRPAGKVDMGADEY